MKNIMLSCMVLLLIMNTASSQTANKNEELIYERDYDLVTENKTLLVVKIEINEEDINKYKIENKKAFIEHCSRLVVLRSSRVADVAITPRERISNRGPCGRPTRGRGLASRRLARARAACPCRAPRRTGMPLRRARSRPRPERPRPPRRRASS